jgi:hypothetical protein
MFMDMAKAKQGISRVVDCPKRASFARSIPPSSSWSGACHHTRLHYLSCEEAIPCLNSHLPSRPQPWQAQLPTSVTTASLTSTLHPSRFCPESYRSPSLAVLTSSQSALSSLLLSWLLLSLLLLDDAFLVCAFTLN